MGTYIGINLTPNTENNIIKYCNDNNILIQESDFSQALHSTVMYSHDNLKVDIVEIVNFLNEKKINPMSGKIVGFDLFWNQATCELSCLGAKLNSDYLCNLNEEIQKRFDIKHAFEDYIPHITFSYNFKDDIEKLPLPSFTIEFLDLYIKDLISPTTFRKKFNYHG